MRASYVFFAGLVATVFAAPPPVMHIEKRQAAAGCKKVSLIFARGTGEQTPMGHSVGPMLTKALGDKFGPDNVKAEGVEYPASVDGATSGYINTRGSPGSKAMAQMAKSQMSSCPTSNIVLSGYSQGAEQVHGALMNLGATGAKIAAAVTFGDPLKSVGGWGSLPKGRYMINCEPGDGVCGGKFSISAEHMAYMKNGDIPKSVDFIAKFVK